MYQGRIQDFVLGGDKIRPGGVSIGFSVLFIEAFLASTMKHFKDLIHRI